MLTIPRPFALAAILLAACGGDKGAAPAPVDQPPATPPAVTVSFDPAEITPARLALGDSLFHGLIGATSCQACHGADAAQGTLAPNLTDAEWLHSDGSLEGIYKTIESGVMAPKKFSSMMPPFGGAPMTPEQTLAVASYVYKLGHK
ncbi:MAG: c-type cytochrome [Gemmatimonadales bacterium]|nr:c-type cytochrome [Gemmatimonadales bacterium]